MKIKAGRPTPGFVLGLIALAVALTGTAWAATKIDTKDIKSKAITSKKLDTAAVTAKKLADKAVTSSKLADKAVTEAKIADSAVTEAKIADSAVTGAKVANDTLNDTKISDYEIVGGSFIKVTATEANTIAGAQIAAPETPLFSKGQASIYAKCFRDTTGAGQIRGEIYARTTADGAVLDGVDQLPSASATLLNTTTVEEDAELDTESATVANTGDFDEAEGALGTPDGTTWQLLTSIGVKQGTLPAGNGVFGDGNVCLFHVAVLGS
jgi:hypothetical protein